MSGAGTLIFAGAVVFFMVACGLQIRRGTDPGKRAWLCLLQTACAAIMVVVAVPSEPKTDVSRYSQAISQSVSERYARALEAIREKRSAAKLLANDGG